MSNVASFVVDPDHGVNPLGVKFTATPVPEATDYKWDFGDGTTGNGITVQHTYNGGGPYNVSLTVVTPVSEAFSSRHGAVIVSRVGNIPADFDGYPIPYTNQQGFPAGPPPLQVVLSGLNTAPGLTLSYVWDFGDGTTLDLGVVSNPKAAHTYLKPGKYTVKLTATGYDSFGFKQESGFSRYNYVTVLDA